MRDEKNWERCKIVEHGDRKFMIVNDEKGNPVEMNEMRDGKWENATKELFEAYQSYAFEEWQKQFNTGGTMGEAKLLNDDPDFKAYVVKQGESIDLRHHKVHGELMPTECYIKPDGSITGRASICFLLENGPGTIKYVAQISKATLKPILDELEKHQ